MATPSSPTEDPHSITEPKYGTVQISEIAQARITREKRFECACIVHNNAHD